MMDGQIQWIELGRLRAHPGNSNVMKPAMLAKLREHIERTGRYPPLIVRRLPGRRNDEGRRTNDECEAGGLAREVARPRGDDRFSHSSFDMRHCAYQVLDGHHRWQVLEALGHAKAACVVWEADDEQALVWLTTLNRLEGRDDPWRRAALVRELSERFGRSVCELAKVLPDAKGDLEKLLKARAVKPTVREAPALATMRKCVSFFLLPGEVVELEQAIERAGGGREAGLMKLVRGGEAHHGGTEDTEGER